MIPVISLVGKHNAGKTTIIIAIVKALSRRGIKTAVIKHASRNLTVEPSEDSEMIFLAGAGIVYAVSPEVSIKYMHQSEPNLVDICEQISPEVDLIITEGYKAEPADKIEVMRREISMQPLSVNNTIARISDFEINDQIPRFAFDQPEEIAEFIMRYFNKT
jgi:molybdopterin-guanine dinucleotide biosynthesis protein B